MLIFVLSFFFFPDGDAIPAVVAKNLAICGTLLLLPFQGCDAAIPTIQEYSIGTGTIIKNKNVEEAPVKAEAVEISSVKDLQKLMSDLLKSFDKLENQINQQAWDDLRVDLARGPAGQLAGAPRLGGGGSKKEAAAAAARLGMTAPRVNDFDEKRGEVLVLLKQLDDYAFSNRVLFFNLEDKKAVTEMSEQNDTSLDLSEPLAILDECRDLIKQIIENDLA
mmetsp:Transcript_4038/g.6442  ORF Transcript_4038/g.6442 Transcript_4038/m.6442 type:complete len:221 (+) Transcript_4038:2-664(+)